MSSENNVTLTERFVRGLNNFSLARDLAKRTTQMNDGTVCGFLSSRVTNLFLLTGAAGVTVLGRIGAITAVNPLAGVLGSSINFVGKQIFHKDPAMSITLTVLLQNIAQIVRHLWLIPALLVVGVISPEWAEKLTNWGMPSEPGGCELVVSEDFSSLESSEEDSESESSDADNTRDWFKKVDQGCNVWTEIPL